MVRLLKFRKLFVPERIPGFAVDLYDREARAAQQRYYSKVAEEIISEIEAGRILDVGTGPGYLPIEIAKRRPMVRIDGIDLSRRMIEVARRNALDAEVSSQIHFEKGNATKLQFEDNCYDLVISTGVFRSWKFPIRPINEIHRVLKPGGLALIYDPALVFTNAEEVWRRCFTCWDRIAFMWGGLTNFLNVDYSTESVLAILNQTHFQDFEVDKKDCIRMRLRKAPMVNNRPKGN